MPKLDPRDPKIRVRPQPPRTPQPKVKPQPPNTSQSRVGSNTGRPLKPTPTPTPRELYMAKLKRQKELKDRTQQSLKSFFQRPSVGKTAIVAITGLIAATFFPVFGPAAALATVAAAITSIQNDLKLLDLPLQEDTINKLVGPLHGQQFDESQLQKVTEGVLSKDRAANEDLAQCYKALVPTIKEAAAAATHIEISGPVQGLIVNPEQSTITQTFNGFLPKE